MRQIGIQYMLRRPNVGRKQKTGQTTMALASDELEEARFASKTIDRNYFCFAAATDLRPASAF
jgi:hypothetical protein